LANIRASRVAVIDALEADALEADAVAARDARTADALAEPEALGATSIPDTIATPTRAVSRRGRAAAWGEKRTTGVLQTGNIWR
jgi:hypothetical protein